VVSFKGGWYSVPARHIRPGQRVQLQISPGHAGDQGLPIAPLGLPEESIAFSKHGQHRDRQSFEPAFPVGAFFVQYRLGIYLTLSAAPRDVPIAD
jgi:uncharacterized protein (DUF2141 family)